LSRFAASFAFKLFISKSYLATMLAIWLYILADGDL